MGSVKRVFDAVGSLFGKRPEADLRVRWFGKLPTRPDYVATPDQPAWAHELSDWLIHGLARWLGQQSGPAPRLADSVGLLRLPRSGMTVLFALRDFGGDARGRAFPFVLFAGLPTARWPGPDAAVLAALAGPLNQMRRNLDDVDTFLHRQETQQGSFERRLEIAEPAGEDVLRQKWTQLGWQQWFCGLGGAAGGDAEQAWPAALEGWGDVIARSDGEDFVFNLCLPLAREQDWALQAAGWLAWVGARARLATRLCSLVCVFEDGQGPWQLFMLARSVLPEDFLLLTPAAASLAYVDRPPLPGAAPPVGRPVGGKGPALAIDIPRTFADFVLGQHDRSRSQILGLA